MRVKQMVLLVIAVSCGLTASIGVSQYLENSTRAAPPVETEDVLVAVQDIDIGEELMEESVRVEKWPPNRVPAGAVSRFAEVAERRFARTRLYAGEPIIRPKLMDSNDSSKAVTIPKGFRVVSVQVSMHSSVSGLVQPGDRVDLLVFLRKSGEVPSTGTKTILHDVNVFAVDTETERRVGLNGQSSVLRTVSLMVRPDQAEAVMLAAELGELSLSLRRPDDNSEEMSEGHTVQSLLGFAETANPPQDQGDDLKNLSTKKRRNLGGGIYLLRGGDRSYARFR